MSENEKDNRERLPREVASKAWSLHCLGKAVSEISDYLCVPPEAIVDVITRCWSEMDERRL